MQRFCFQLGLGEDTLGRKMQKFIDKGSLVGEQ
jgi:hypothetical protein